MSTLPVTVSDPGRSIDLAEEVSLALEAIATPIWIVDRDYRWCFLNQACEPLLGGDLVALVGQSGAEVLPSGVAEMLIAAADRAIATGEDQSHSVELTDTLEERRSLVATTRRFLPSGGERLLMVTLQDATPLHQVRQLNTDLEQQVAQRTEELQTALDFEATLKRITDRVRDSLDVNQIMLTAVKELTEALDVKGSNTSLYDLEQGTSTIYYEYNSSSPSYQGRVAQMEAFPEVYHQLLDGQYFQFCSVEPNPVRGYVAMLACPVVDDRGVLGDLWLINDRDYGFKDIQIRLVQQVANQCAIAIRQARLYQAAQSQVAELERLNTLKDDFLSTVSHELRTPVTSMRVALQLLGVTLNQEFDLSADLHKPRAEQSRISRYYGILKEECEREISLINDLLDLQRLDVGNHPIQPEPILLDTWIAGWIDSFVTRAKSRDQTLQLVTAPALPVIHSDPASLERVLAELLNNACKYTPPGEHISLHVLPHPAAPADQVCLVLTNTGVTIPAEEMPRIFDKFYRVPSADPWKQGGTGLGLALVKKLVLHLGGDLEVTSADDQTCFTIILPTQ